MAVDPNSMQAQLGLAGQPGSLNPLGIQTPPPPPLPAVKSPGEFSADITRQTQTMSMQTMQSAMMTRPGAMGGMPSTMPGTPLGGYAAGYQANMASMNGQIFNPYVAQALAGAGGGQGFTPGMMPSPIQMTQPGMGIYRPFPAGPTPSMSPTPQMPMFPTPFTPQMPSPRFQTPFEFHTSIAAQQNAQWNAAGMAAPGAVARGMVDMGAGYAGAGIGANLGARMFGARGAAVGAGIGMLGGMAASEMGGFGGAAQHMVDAVNPFRMTAIRSAQMRAITPDFVVGGSDLSPSGRGLSYGGNQMLARGLANTGYDAGFKRETGGAYSVQDLTRITQSAGQNGLLDFTQNPEEIAGKVKNIAKALRTFMRIAGEPDVREALKQMGQMQSMGLSLPETMNVMSNARMYSKMAGTSVKGIMESGLAGAATFQQQGLSAGLGLEVGMGSMGMARQAIAGGAYTTQQVGMLGGVQGIAQREMMSHAATLQLPMMAASMSKMGAGGTFGLDAGSVKGLVGGHYDIGQLTSMGANNLQDAVRQHGVGAIGMFQMQQKQIQDQLGRAMGPMGGKLASMNQVMNTAKMLNLSGPGGIASASQAMGMDAETSQQLMGQMNSPGFFQGVQGQLNAQRTELRADAYDTHQHGKPGFFEDITRRIGIGRGLSNSIGDLGSAMGNTLYDPEEAAARSSGQTFVRGSSSLQASSQMGTRNLAKVTDAEIDSAQKRAGPGNDDYAIRAGDGRVLGTSSTLGRVRDAYGGDQDDLASVRQAQGGWRAKLGGGLLEQVSRTSVLGAIFGSSKEENAATRARQGVDSDVLTKGLHLTDKDRDALGKTVDASLRLDLEIFLAKKADDGVPLWGPSGQLEVMAAVDEFLAGKNKKLSPDQKKDLATSAIEGAKMRAGKGGKLAFDAHDMTSAGARKRLVVGLDQSQTKLAKSLMGSTGSALQRKQTLDAVLEGTEHKESGGLAAIMASGNAQAEKAYIANLDPKRSAAIQKEARSLMDKTQDLRPELSAMGSTLAALKPENMVGAATTAASEYRANERAGQGLKKDAAGNYINDGSSSQTFGGIKNSNESAVDQTQEGVSDLAKKAMEMFPESSKTFSEGSAALLETAKVLGKVDWNKLSNAIEYLPDWHHP